MKLKITIILILLIALTGCASFKSGPKKLPRCSGQNIRMLNQGKWNWNNNSTFLHNTAIKPITTPIILNTQENEAPKAHVELPAPPVNTINHQTPSYTNAEITHEK
ncbi:conjugal transfer protein TraJ [Bartonella sp. C271]|uniref:conjugal transfer protein TraJ n=1 Tax=Bartonella sp. C271 TaxID=3070220 RepID=UPI0038B53D06